MCCYLANRQDKGSSVGESVHLILSLVFSFLSRSMSKTSLVNMGRLKDFLMALSHMKKILRSPFRIVKYFREK